MARATSHNILIVDDDDELSELLQVRLRRDGFDAIRISSVGEIETACEGAHPAAIVMDLNLGMQDGLQAAEELARLGFHGPVILMSGSDERVITAARRHAEGLGLKLPAIFHKPFSPAELSATIGGLLPAASPPPATDMRKVLAEGGVRPFFQPQYDLKSGRLMGCEALARRISADAPPRPPADFFDEIERERLWPELTDCMLRGAVAAVADWRAQGLTPCKIAINLEAETAIDPEFGPHAIAILTEAGLSTDAIRFEITEKAAMGDATAALRALTWLRIKGFDLAIDDFGTGFSSLAALHAMPFSELKIDQSFIRNLETDRDSRVIVKATIDLAHNLDLTCVAEGVETAETWTLLRDMGCDQGQGYFFGRPVDASAFSRFLLEGKIATPWQTSTADPS